MNQITIHKKSVILHDLIIKKQYKNSFQIPQITKLLLNVGLKDSFFDKKKILLVLLLLELITGQKSCFTTSKKNKIYLNVKKGSIVGCKITLRKKYLNIFLEKLIFFYFPQEKNFKGIKVPKKFNKALNFTLKNCLNFFELKEEFLRFQKIPPINITILTNSKNLKEMFLLLNSYQFPLLLEKRK